MAWHLGPIIAFDTETTGPDPQTARVVSASLVVQAGLGGKPEMHSWLVNPGVDIPAEATAVHGITTEIAHRDGKNPVDVLTELTGLIVRYAALGVPIAIMRAAFDLTILDRELRRHHLPLLGECLGDARLLVLDPFVLDKQCDRYRRGRRTLTALCEHYDILLGDAHTSGDDALATLHLTRALAGRFPELAAYDLETLHDRQTAWHAEQAASLEAYFRRSGDADAQVDRAWPFIPIPDRQDAL